MSAFAHIRFAAKSDVGRKRRNNEDSFGAFPESGVFCVADGMGGGDDGEIASAAVVKEVAAFAQAHVPPGNVGYFGKELASGLSHSLNDASAWIFKRAKDRNLKGCGSTFVGVCLDATAPGSAIALHVGDSRLYRVRGASIRQITRDHSAAELIGAKDESTISPCFRGVILRAVGVQPSVEVEQTELPLKEGDRIVICSDGLSKMVDDRRISAIVHSSKTPDEAVNALVAAANDAGGIDNITAIVMFVGHLPLARPGVSVAQSQVQDMSCPPTDDSSGFDTSDTDTGNEFAREADTDTDAQTIETEAPSSPSSNPAKISAQSQESNGAALPSSAGFDRFAGRTWIFLIGVVVLVSITAAAVSLVCFHVLMNRNGAALTIVRSAEEGFDRKTISPGSGQLEPNGSGKKAVEPEKGTNLVGISSVGPQPAAEGRKMPSAAQVADGDVLRPVQAMQEDKWAESVLPLLAASCAPSNSKAFVKTVRRFPNNGSVEALTMRFRPICDDSLSMERRRAIAKIITEDVQDIAHELRKYSDKRLRHIDAALSDHMTRAEFREKLMAEREGLAAFAKASETFLGSDPSTAESQIACANIMSGIVRWLKQIK